MSAPEGKEQPKDKYNLVYVIVILIGIGTTLPWNTFINANSVCVQFSHPLLSHSHHEQYFVEHKLADDNSTDGGDYSAYRNSFISYLGVFAMAPNVLFQFWNFWFNSGSVSHSCPLLPISHSPASTDTGQARSAVG